MAIRRTQSGVTATLINRRSPRWYASKTCSLVYFSGHVSGQPGAPCHADPESTFVSTGPHQRCATYQFDHITPFYGKHR